MLRRDIGDLQNRYQASERRCEELITQVPESTRPLLRQIEAMQEAEAKSATAEENERAMNERLSQTLSRAVVLEAQRSLNDLEPVPLGATFLLRSALLSHSSKSFSADALVPEYSRGEIGCVSGIPDEHLRRKVSQDPLSSTN
ncbi:hypothetical protein IFM89_037219 [Coptis chinensis]|uniref:Uncharacterized protein n=1 Tax=Coptis chinensis TaxID=261450 RepID=A0A835LKP4_9MAGN|nr:hypothetical protein IFM89_037219 [Coptis chinensis]